MYTAITHLLESHEHVGYGLRTADAWEWIAAAEEQIGHKFPPSLRWILNRYIAIEVRRFEVCGVHEPGTEDLWVGDIIRCFERGLEHGLIDEHEIPVCDDDFGGFFYLDTSITDSDGEMPVYLKRGSESLFFADNFLKFLERFITAEPEWQ